MRVAHLDAGLEDVRTHERCHGGGDAAEIVSDDAGDLFVAEAVGQADEVADEVRHGVLFQGDVVEGFVGPARGAAVAALVHGDAVVACRGDGGHDLAPGEGELWVAVAEEDEWVARLAGLEDVEGEAAGGGAVDVGF